MELLSLKVKGAASSAHQREVDGFFSLILEMTFILFRARFFFLGGQRRCPSFFNIKSIPFLFSFPPGHLANFPFCGSIFFYSKLSE